MRISSRRYQKSRYRLLFYCLRCWFCRFISSSTFFCASDSTLGGVILIHFLGSSKERPPCRLLSVCLTCAGWLSHNPRRVFCKPVLLFWGSSSFCRRNFFFLGIFFCACSSFLPRISALCSARAARSSGVKVPCFRRLSHLSCYRGDFCVHIAKHIRQIASDGSD